jgi:putative ABC transport system permease protein
MLFISLVIKNLTRRPLRNGLTLLGFATAIAAVVSLLGVTNGFRRSFSDVYESHAVDIVVSRHGSADRLSSSVDQSFVERIARLPDVAAVAGVLLETLSLEDYDAYGIPTMGIARGSWLIDDYTIRDRSVPSDQPMLNAGEHPTVMLGVYLADRVAAKGGQSIPIFEVPYLVSGIFESGSTWENGSMILSLEQLQGLTDRPGQVTYINVVLEDSVDQEGVSRLIEAIEALDPKLHAMTTRQYVDSDARMRIASAMAWMTSLIALVIGAIGTLNTMMTSVLERTVEIGILRAVGWPRHRVVRMILLESIFLAIVAALVGSLIGIALTSLMGQAPAARGILDPQITVAVLGKGLLLALVIGCLGALAPAWRAAQLSPTDAFREN